MSLTDRLGVVEVPRLPVQISVRPTERRRQEQTDAEGFRFAVIPIGYVEAAFALQLTCELLTHWFSDSAMAPMLAILERDQELRLWPRIEEMLLCDDNALATQAQQLVFGAQSAGRTVTMPRILSLAKALCLQQGGPELSPRHLGLVQLAAGIMVEKSEFAQMRWDHEGVFLKLCFVEFLLRALDPSTGAALVDSQTVLGHLIAQLQALDGGEAFWQSAGGIQTIVQSMEGGLDGHDAQLVGDMERCAAEADKEVLAMDASELVAAVLAMDRWKGALPDGWSTNRVRVRVLVFRLLNTILRDCLLLTGLHRSDVPDTLAIRRRLQLASACVFFGTKLAVIDPAIEQTWAPESDRLDTVYLHRGKALAAADGPQPDDLRTSECLFVQGWRALRTASAALRCRPHERKEYVFPVKFRVFGSNGQTIDEPGIDWGGLYSEAINSFVLDVFDDEAVRLCVPVPNEVTHVGASDTFIPNTGLSLDVAGSMFEFLGKLIGVAIRHKNPLPFRFPPLIWKRILQTLPSADDLHDIDSNCAKLLQQLRQGDVPDEDVQQLRWQIPSAVAPHQIALKPEEPQQALTPADVPDFCDLAEQSRLTEFDAACQHMRSGILHVIPAQMLQLLTWKELRRLASGSRTTNTKLMEGHTKYDAAHPRPTSRCSTFSSVAYPSMPHDSHHKLPLLRADCEQVHQSVSRGPPGRPALLVCRALPHRSTLPAVEQYPAQ